MRSAYERKDFFMLCRNCQKEIGQQRACHYCGFDPMLDSGETPISQAAQYVPPKPVTITPIKSTNGMAITAFIFSLLSVIPGVGILSFLFGIIGFFKAKKCRKGRVMSVISLLITLLTTAAFVGLIYVLIQAANGSYDIPALMEALAELMGGEIYY